MTNNKLTDLRDHLFATLESLRDEDDPMDINRAKAISEVAQTIINSARVEVDLLRTVSGSSPGTAFFGSIPEEDLRAIPDSSPRRRLS